MRALRLAAIGIAASVSVAAAQGYRVRLDTRFETAAYRGVTADSILSADVKADSTGALYTPDGIAVQCLLGARYCTYFRPGPVERGGPMVTTADFSLWGLGVRGLSARGMARLGVDVGTGDVWPGTDPAMQLVEGYLEYARGPLTADLGRTHVINRFGYTGFDGALATGRLFAGQLSATAYGGWGLARGVALPVNSPALQPLDEYQPQDRQWVAGGEIAWRLPAVTGRVIYQRQVDRRSDYFVSERAGFDLALRPMERLTITGGADYDLAEGWWGSWEASGTYLFAGDRANVTVGARRYRPFFELWTIWGAFSPVPYNAQFAALEVRPIRRLTLRTRGEIYRYDDANVSTPLSTADTSGWRWSLGATAQVTQRLSLDWNYHLEFGPGASSRGFEAYATWQPRADLTLSGQVAQLQRPLEFRYDEPDVWAFGANGSYALRERVHVNLGVLMYREARNRPDAAAFDWNQLRLNAGISLLLGSGADRTGLPDAILRIPEAGGGR